MNTRLAIGLFLLATATAALAEPHRTPSITLSPVSLSITAPAGGPNPAPSPVTLTNSGNPKMDWAASSDSTWLDVNPKSGNLTPGTSISLSVTVNVLNPVVLAVGIYPGHIKITSTSASNSPVSLPVTLTVSASAVMALTPASISLAAPVGTGASKSVTLQNSGGSTMDWTTSTAQGWIHASPASGSLGAGTSVSVSVQLDAQSGPGTFTGTLSFNSAGTSGAPQNLGVTFTVSALPLIGLSPLTLTFDAPQGGVNPVPPQFLSLTNTGGQDLLWTATPTSTPAWLGISAPTSGTLSGGSGQALTIVVNTSPGGTALVEGTYTGTITVAGTGSTGTPAANSPQTVQVTLNVNSEAKISLNPAAASFSVSVDSVVSGPAGISITNTGSGTLVWSTTGGPSWLGVSPSGGTLGPLASQSIILTANGSGLPPGFYTGTIEVDGINQTGVAPFPPASNSPQTIAVDLTVDPSTKPTEAPAGQCGLSGLEAVLVLLAIRIHQRGKRGGVK
jgi:hypothetical protein